MIKIGYAPTRRDCFTHRDANEMRHKIYEYIKGFGAELVDITDINDEGLLMNELDVDKTVDIFQKNGVDGIFVPHCNFGSEGIVSRIAAKTGKPVLLWGPRDGVPSPDVDRTRDTQCGLFATGKALRRMNVPFTYLVNTALEDPAFERGYKSFVAVCAVVKAFRSTRVLQIDVRPDPFLTVMCNEGELLERFGIQVFPITLPDLKEKMDELAADSMERLETETAAIKSKVTCQGVADYMVLRLATLKSAIKDISAAHGCNCVAIQCWGPLQKAVGAAACTINGLLTEEGLPVACETDIHGAVTSVMLQAAAMYETSVFFADLTIRHPHNDNAELLWHCGNFPPCLAKEKCVIKCLNEPPVPAQNHCELKHGDITVCRFDGDHGQYSMFIGEGKGVDGPKTPGTYSWFEVGDWPMWEDKLVCGPYIHHCTGVHARVAPVLYEACKYIGVEADPASPTEDEIKAYWRGK